MLINIKIDWVCAASSEDERDQWFEWVHSTIVAHRGGDGNNTQDISFVGSTGNEVRALLLFAVHCY